MFIYLETSTSMFLCPRICKWIFLPYCLDVKYRSKLFNYWIRFKNCLIIVFYVILGWLAMLFRLFVILIWSVGCKDKLMMGVLYQHQTWFIQVKVRYVLVIQGAVYPGSLHFNYFGLPMFSNPLYINGEIF